ncbi:MAG: hypothetical protein IKD04_04590 [Clostridia bacterium]|nr:hypothetical protein [Clostridia bacterium]
MENFNLKYFLAANSCEGFLSCFSDSYSKEKGWKAYIIKGGPGTGKSSFMKYLAAAADKRDIKCLLCPCSSDPNSLDAVIFPEKKAVILDGTAPHTVDPVYPGVCEQILNFGTFWHEEAFSASGEEIISLTDRNKALHKAASRYMQAAGQLMTDNLKNAAACTDKIKAERFAVGLCRKMIPKTAAKPSEQVRFLCGITPKGVVSYAETALKETEKTVIIEDEYGAAANIIMRKIREWALDGGYSIITVKNAFLPSKLIDHIIIPELSLSFVREYDYQHFSSDSRRIHARRFMSAKQLSRSRERMKFNKKAIRQLLLSAVTVLSQAKKVHDELEKHYISAMDFEALTAFAKDFSERLFG